MTKLSLSGNLAGVAAMLLAMALLPLSDSIAKYLVETYPAEQVSFFRGAVHGALLLPVVLYFHGWRSIWVECKPDQFIRAACFSLMAVCYIIGLGSTPLAEGMATIFLFPGLILIGSALFLGEKVGFGRWAATIAGFVGVTIVAGATFNQAGPGILWIIAGAFFTAVYGVVTKKVTNRAPILVVGVFPALFGSIGMAFPAAAGWVMPTLDGFALMLLVGFIAGTAHVLIVVAYAHSDASLIAPLAYAQIVFGIFYGLMIFGTLPSPTAWIGMAVIIASGVFMGLHERRKATGASGRR